ncbi:MAG: FMN-binding protein [Planctomycetota bacterium]
MNNKMIRFAVILVITASLATAGVALIYGISKPEIEKKKKKTQNEAIAIAFNVEPDDFAKKYEVEGIDKKEPHECWKVREKGNREMILGYAATGEAGGYGDKIRLIAAVDAGRKKLIGTMIYDIKETPGLGNKAIETEVDKTWLEEIFGIRFGAEKKYSGPLERVPFLWQFHNKAEDELKVVKGEGKGIRAITGATITSNAVTTAVRNAWKKIGKEAQTGASSPPPE